MTSSDQAPPEREIPGRVTSDRVTADLAAPEQATGGQATTERATTEQATGGQATGGQAIFDWSAPMGLPPFERIASGDFAAAFDVALAAERAEIDALSADPAAPTFDNTIVVLESSGRALARVSRLFWNLLGANADPVLEALQTDIAPRLSRHASRTASDAALFARVDDLWRRRETLALSGERARVLERTWRRFVRGGARLDGAAREELADLLARLSALGAAFGQNLLADERDWTLPVEEAAVLGALPESLVSAMRGAARERGGDGHLVTTSRSLMTPFLTFCPDRALRRQAFEGWTSRGARGAAITTTGRSSPRSSRCASGAPSCSATPPSPRSSSRTRWRARPGPCSSCSSASGRVPCPPPRPSGRRSSGGRPRRAPSTPSRPSSPRGTGPSTPRRYAASGSSWTRRSARAALLARRR